MVYLQSATKLPRHCTKKGNFEEQNNPHPSPLPSIQSWGICCFLKGSLNSGTTLHGGDEGGKALFYPFEVVQMSEKSFMAKCLD